MQIQIPWKRTKLKVKSNSQISLKQIVFFQKSFFNLKPIENSKKKWLSLCGQVLVLHDDLKKNAGTIFRQELSFFHGIKKEKGKDTNTIIINTVKEEMGIEILRNDLDRLHCFGNPKTKKKERLIIVKLAS